MSLRQIDVYEPSDRKPIELGETGRVLDRRVVTLEDDRRLVRLLVDVDQAEAVLDAVQESLAGADDVRVVVTEVEATLPRPEAPEEEEEEAEDDGKTPGRVSREEIYQDVAGQVRVGWVHYVFVVLSVVVAAGGMLRNEVAVVIGAMVIAPLIGPNIALALGTTLADTELLRRSGRVNVIGLLLGLGLSLGLGFVLTVDPTIPEIASRTNVRLSDIVLALAAGTAGALSMARGISTSLVGVMVAVALVPPLVAVGLLTGGGQWGLAYRAALLLTTNVVCINLSAVGAFLALGLRPTTWYDARRARRSTVRALLLWTAALGVLTAAIWLAR